MRRPAPLLALAALALALGAGCAAPRDAAVPGARPAGVQDARTAEAPDERSGPPGAAERPAARPWKVSLGLRAYGTADLDDGGELGLARTALGLGRRVPTGERAGWWLAFRGEGSRYDLDGGALGLADPPEDLAETLLLASYESRGPDRQWFAGVSLLAGAEEGVRESETLRLKAIGGHLWRAGEGLSLGVGLIGRTHLEDDPEAIPIPLVEWRIDERQRLGVVRSADPGLGYTYRASDALELYLAFSWWEREYRLDDDAGLDDAALVDQEYALRLGAVTRRPSGFEAELALGGAWRELTVDADDRRLARDDVDPTLSLVVSVGWRF